MSTEAPATDPTETTVTKPKRDTSKAIEARKRNAALRREQKLQEQLQQQQQQQQHEVKPPGKMEKALADRKLQEESEEEPESESEEEEKVLIYNPTPDDAVRRAKKQKALDDLNEQMNHRR